MYLSLNVSLRRHQPANTDPPWICRECAETLANGSPRKDFIVTCPIFSLMAWVMGSHDLAEMRAGRMDRSGEGLTQAGQILGMVIGGFCILGAAVGLFLFAVVAIAGKF